MSSDKNENFFEELESLINDTQEISKLRDNTTTPDNMLSAVINENFKEKKEVKKSREENQEKKEVKFKKTRQQIEKEQHEEQKKNTKDFFQKREIALERVRNNQYKSIPLNNSERSLQSIISIGSEKSLDKINKYEKIEIKNNLFFEDGVSLFEDAGDNYINKFNSFKTIESSKDRKLGLNFLDFQKNFLEDANNKKKEEKNKSKTNKKENKNIKSPSSKGKNKFKTNKAE